LIGKIYVWWLGTANKITWECDNVRKGKGEGQNKRCSIYEESFSMHVKERNE
jgi:hypothetical protein